MGVYSMKRVLYLLKTAGQNAAADNITTLSSSLAYSTVFSIAPLLIITIGVVGIFFGNNGGTETVYSTVQELIGPDGAKAVEGMVEAAAKKPDAGYLATITGILMLIVGAASVFQQLQQSLNIIWKVRPKAESGWGPFIRQKLLSFSMVVVVAFLLLVSLLLNTGLSVVGSLLGGALPGGTVVWHIVEFCVSFGVISLLFAAIFKVLPDVELSWRDVSVGSLFTALLFNIGKMLIGFYLGQTSAASAYGAVGSLVVVLLWVYYSSAIVFFGAEFTRVLLIESGRNISPLQDAELISITTQKKV